MKLIYSERIRRFIDFLIIGLFGLLFFSIPCFSFLPKLSIITWILSITIFILIFLSQYLYYGFQIDIIIWCFIFFILNALIGSALVGFRDFLMTPILNTLAIIFFYSYCRSNKKAIFPLIISSFAGIVLFGFIFLFSYKNEILSFQFQRLGNAFGDVNDISITFCIGYAISIYLVLFLKKWWLKILTILSALLLVLLSFTSGSRIAILLILVATYVSIILKFGLKKWYLSFLIIFICTSIFILTINLPIFRFLKDRTLNMLYTFIGKSYNNINYDNSSIIRVDMIKNGFSLFLRRPIFGNGVNGFHMLSSWHNGWSHNHYSDSLCNYGIVGTIFYHTPLIIFFKNVKKTDLNKLSILLIICFIFSTLSIALFKEKFFSFIIGVLLASSEKTDFKYNICIRKSRVTVYENC